MKIYLLQARKRINQHANETLWDIGIFKSPSHARRYIKENKDIFDREKELGFFALLECELNVSPDLWIHSQYDRNGSTTYLFRK